MRGGSIARGHVALLVRVHLSGASFTGVSHLFQPARNGALLRMRAHHEAAGFALMVRLTERDLRVIGKCAVAKWLSTQQLQRLYFGEVTADAVRKSLRRLAEEGYLFSFRANQMSEILHAVGPKGRTLLKTKGLDSDDPGRTPPRQLEHLLGINNIRIAVERGSEPVAYFFAAWELPRLGWSHPVIPDAVFGIKDGRRRTFLVEYDRGTETLPVFLRKLRSCDSGLFGVSYDAILVFADTEQRLEGLSRGLRGNLTRPVLGALIPQIEDRGLYARFFVDLRRREARKLALQDLDVLDDPLEE